MMVSHLLFNLQYLKCNFMRRSTGSISLCTQTTMTIKFERPSGTLHFDDVSDGHVIESFPDPPTQKYDEYQTGIA